MPHTGFACPTCDAAGTMRSLLSKVGQMGYYCEGGHTFDVDTETLSLMSLKKIAVPVPVKKPREGLVQFAMAIPGKLLEALRAKFGPRLESSVEAVMTALLDSSSFIMTGFDVDKAGAPDFLGQRVKDSSQLLGLIFSMRYERDELRREVELYKANTKGSSNGTAVEVNDVAGDFVQVQLRLTVDDFVALKDKAKFNGKPPAQYLSEVLSMAITNGWL